MAHPYEKPPFVTTVAFTSDTREAHDAFWADIRDRYNFMGDREKQGTRAFAVSASNMFAEQDAIDELLNANLDKEDLEDAIGRIACCDDLSGLLAEYGVEVQA